MTVLKVICQWPLGLLIYTLLKRLGPVDLEFLCSVCCIPSRASCREQVTARGGWGWQYLYQFRWEMPPQKFIATFQIHRDTCLLDSVSALSGLLRGARCLVSGCLFSGRDPAAPTGLLCSGSIQEECLPVKVPHREGRFQVL